MTQDTTKPSKPEFFNQEMAQSYDDRNSKFGVVKDNVHFHVNLVLEDLPDDARVLCVGAGTGIEIIALSSLHPKWRFVALDPSKPMLDVCAKNLENANITDRCELIHGYVQDAPNSVEFDAVISLFVAHFIPVEDRPSYYKNIHDRLKKGACFVSTELSFDLDSAEFPAMLENWKSIHKLMGATPESLEALPQSLRDTLSILSPKTTESLLKEAGFGLPVQYLQNFMIRGWYSVK
ncbi:class I SAM-dependent methyltransferase [Hirschia litorea]|uniref:Class I SAM-dependent methyltransferase n=1 Tax=Hirschia litorea TaxID=1199156 RepID=A0ABW2IP79_9PROT